MKKKEILKVNSKIEIMSQDDDTIYKSLIQDIFDDSFLIGVPVYKRHKLNLHKGDIVNVTAFSGSSCFNFFSEVLGKREENGLSLYILKKPHKYKKIERRDFVRVEVALEVKYEIISDRKNWEKVKPSQKAFSIDLSGGGVQLILPEDLPPHSLLVLEIPIDIDCTDITMKLLGQVVRSEEEKIADISRFKTGIKFEDISERERDIIIRFVFSQMRKTLHLRRSDS
ncbi:MAG: hypothetical protein PWQ96_792 [Clostridia bacterium]|nr:hypothetical protein [Clostridia bacterium]